MHQNNLREWGQHFLIDSEVIKDFLRLANVKNNEKILEIGPGEGVLTRELAKQAQTITALEIDETLKPKLDKLQKDHSNLSVHYINALEWDNFNYHLVCGAISWAIFEPLMIKLYSDFSWARGVFLVSAKTKKACLERKGLLGQLLNAFFNTHFSDIIPQEKFNPAPRYPGIIIALSRKKVLSAEERFWQELFLQADKKIKNSLREALINLQLAPTKREAKQKLGLLPEKIAEKSNWQLSNEQLGKINEIVVYSLHAQP